MAGKFAVALSLLLALPQSSWAQTAAGTGPLPAGKPAGLHQAQAADYNGAIFVGALVIIAAVGFLVSTRRYVVPGQSTGAPSGTTG